jgi:hypothetical protein
MDSCLAEDESRRLPASGSSLPPSALARTGGKALLVKRLTFLTQVLDCDLNELGSRHFLIGSPLQTPIWSDCIVSTLRWMNSGSLSSSTTDYGSRRRDDTR